MKYKIQTVFDDYDCETCGSSYAEGFFVTEEGSPLPIVNLIPLAHCTGGKEFELSDALNQILIKLGHEVELDGEPI